VFCFSVYVLISLINGVVLIATRPQLYLLHLTALEKLCFGLSNQQKIVCIYKGEKSKKEKKKSALLVN